MKIEAATLAPMGLKAVSSSSSYQVLPRGQSEKSPMRGYHVVKVKNHLQQEACKKTSSTKGNPPMRRDPNPKEGHLVIT